MRRSAQLSLLGVLVAMVAFIGAPVHAQERYPVTIMSVVDGDTVRVRLDSGATATVRLIGIDTPETKHPSKPVQCFGLEASAKTAELLPIDSRVELELDVQDRDRYARTLAYLWRDGTMVNEQLVAEGYALSLTLPPNVRYAERFKTASASARDAGLGLWTACAGIPLEATDDAPLADDATPADGMTTATPAAPSTAGCDPSYPDFCIPPPPPDLNCTSPQIAGRKNFTVLQPDPHKFDADRDGVGCESRR